jgi:DNA-binding NtrC family response regulator
MEGTVLIVDDEVQLVRHLEHLLKREGYQAFGVHNAADAKKAVSEYDPDVILVDLRLPDADGTTLMAELQQEHSGIRFIMITAYGSIKSAVEATRLGALDYLAKPFEPDELLISVRNAIREKFSQEEIRLLRSANRPKYKRRNTKQAAGQDPATQYTSEAMRQTVLQARQAAAGDSIVLLLGESGSGKDYLARIIHDNSRRKDGPFFALNCAAVSPELAESELFGHEPGAFTGARGRKRGLLELAEGGTLLLNEIGELSMPMQAKLLTFLDTRMFNRVGGESQIKVNARLIAATNRDLEEEVALGSFRRDLFYRLNVISIKIPPLRHRIDDLPDLAREIVDQLVEDMALHDVPDPDDETIRLLSTYNWPGNVRELRNVLERWLMLPPEDRANLTALGIDSRQENWSYTLSFPTDKDIHEVTRDMKRSLVQEALRRSSGSKQGAARLLGISRHALAYQLKSIGLDD